MKTLQKALLTSLVLSSPLALAIDYIPYAEVGVGYNISGQSSVIDPEYKQRKVLYGNSVISYHLEAGVKIPVGKGNTVKVGAYWYDLLNQDESSEMHKPYKFEIFSDYVWNFSKNTFFSVGAGYKLAEETEIDYTIRTFHANLERKAYIGDDPLVDKVSARFSAGKVIGDYTVSVSHHSQWFKGRPFNHRWEYHVTYVGISYSF
jgi:hypothetical protein